MKRNLYFTAAIALLSITIYYFFPEKSLQLKTGEKIDSLVILKGKRKLLVFSKQKLLKTYIISLGKNPVGNKAFEGDKKTPEGKYTIAEKRKKSAYYKGLLVSYPNKEDIDRANQSGKPAGGNILIHSLPDNWAWMGKFHRFIDWTNGCIALTNPEMDELYHTVDVGTPVEIKK
jgi:murein L,D-transpeptidase YafK